VLYERALHYITERAVPEAAAATLNIGIVENAQTVDPTFYPRAGLLLPYHHPDGSRMDFQRVRYFDPPEVGGVRKKQIRYQQPKGTAPQVYLPQVTGFDWQAILADPAQPIIITEGEIKSASVMVNTGLPTLGLGGVFMFADNKSMLPLFEATKWERRRVFIVFDSDIDTKVGVQLAEARLAQWLLHHRAVVHTCRLPPTANGGKQGADDFIAAHGGQAFLVALQSARSLTDLDLRVIELNGEVAYLDGEEKIIEIGTGNLIRKDSFTSGSRYSTLKVPMQDGDKIKMVSVAQTWLTHPMATRYANTLFLPGGDEVIVRPDGTYLNSWREQPCRPGDPTPFLDLTRFVFGETLGDEWDWPIKLLAYKTQNPTLKIPLSIILIGDQGSGKSLWSAMAREAFGEFSASCAGSDLAEGENWNGFLERSLLVTIDDVTTGQMRKRIATLRNWISEPKFKRKEKYLKNRENVDNFALIFITSNYRDAGAFAHDDRRFLVVGCPTRKDGIEWYDPMYAMLRSGECGPILYHYLLHYDLQGWKPPISAPMTAEKRMAYEESLSPFERLARDMMRSEAHVVVQWLQMAEQWAYGVIGSPGHPDTPRANEILTAIQHFPIRPWYTADELCNMFPHMLADLHTATKFYSHATMPGKVSTALRNNGIKYLRNTDDADGFMWRGRRQQFLVVCPSAPYPREMSQAQFDAAVAEMGTYQPRIKRSN
jgi:hypothetical protein